MATTTIILVCSQLKFLRKVFSFDDLLIIYIDHIGDDEENRLNMARLMGHIYFYRLLTVVFRSLLPDTQRKNVCEGRDLIAFSLPFAQSL